MLRLQEHLESWRRGGRRIEAILGIDQEGTSQEALELALSLFDCVYITHADRHTFHPKIYLFTGETYARVYVGSNNLTVGGTETNFEAAVAVSLPLPAAAKDLASFESAWDDLLPGSCPATTLLTAQLLQDLLDCGDVVSEQMMRTSASRRLRRGIGGTSSQFLGVPASPFPRARFQSGPAIIAASVTGEVVSRPAAVRGLAIQIRPQHNGEVYLSRIAVRQNPTFFGWPFTGRTTPKLARNPSYPQRDPDPVVDIEVFGEHDRPVLTLSSFHLNMVYYERRSEIRITVSPLVGLVPEYSVMVIEPSDEPRTSYRITIYTPDSPQYTGWESVCNQTMPGGGKVPRRFGWF